MFEIKHDPSLGITRLTRVPAKVAGTVDDNRTRLTRSEVRGLNRGSVSFGAFVRKSIFYCSAGPLIKPACAAVL